MRKHELTIKKIDNPPNKKAVETSLKGVSPFIRMEREMLSTLNEMEHWFEDALHRPFFGFNRLPLLNTLGKSHSGDFVPSLDVFEEGSELVIKAELAGIKREDISVELSDNMLILRGEKRGEQKVDRRNYYSVEQTFGSFCRSVDLPDGVKLDQIKASYRNGLLEIRIPKDSEPRKVRTVPIEE